MNNSDITFNNEKIYIAGLLPEEIVPSLPGQTDFSVDWKRRFKF